MARRPTKMAHSEHMRSPESFRGNAGLIDETPLEFSVCACKQDGKEKLNNGLNGFVMCGKLTGKWSRQPSILKDWKHAI